METTLALFELTEEGFNYDQTHALVGKLLRCLSAQKTAADLASSPMAGGEPLMYDSGSPKIDFICARKPNAGESMTIDVIRVRNGAASSILTGLFTYDSTKLAGTLYSLDSLIDPAKMPLLKGDVLQVTRDYTAGGGALPITDTLVSVEPRPTITIPNGT